MNIEVDPMLLTRLDERTKNIQKSIEITLNWLEEHEKRIGAIEAWRNQIYGVIIATSVIFTTIGTGIGVALTIYFKV